MEMINELDTQQESLEYIFHYKIHVNFGEFVYVSGNQQILGNWEPKKALRMQWTESDHWILK